MQSHLLDFRKFKLHVFMYILAVCWLFEPDF
uniref:Uncharacterized protein n=1 Tax=Anguilla anguilla TaxID=7936 RepID=A0A0E9TRR3_ANGAN